MKCAVILAGGLVALLPAQEDLGLPDWEDGELEALESGSYVPGSSLMGALAREILDSEEQEVIELDPMVRDLPEEALEPEGLSKLVGGEFISVYFHQPPEGFLNDPQKLLTTQEYQDRDFNLNYHARNHHTRDTDIDCYLYLFDELQELPGGESLESLVKSQFDPERPAAIVFYFLGDPKRSQLVFSDQVIEVVNQNEREKVLPMAIEEALEKSDRSSQLESFLIQLSIQLKRLEEEVAEGGGTLMGGRRLILTEDEPLVEDGEGIWETLVRNEALLYGLTIAAILIPVAMLGLLGRWIADKRRVYLFPDAEGAPLLEAPHAAGVGGVLSFASATTSPSSQKNDDPDYLQKM